MSTDLAVTVSAGSLFHSLIVLGSLFLGSLFHSLIALIVLYLNRYCAQISVQLDNKIQYLKCHCVLND